MIDTEQFRKRVARERAARKQAEQLLEDKSRQLFEANKKLELARQELEERVRTRTAELQTTNEYLQLEIKEHQQTQTALAEARDEALEASRLKSEFLANMSHEIRTPLNAIIGLTNLMLDGSLNDEQADFLKTIHLSGDSLLTLINDILDFSRIEANKLELETQPFSLRECIEDAIDLLAQKAFEKGLELAYEMIGSTPRIVSGDVTRLRQILVNLLNNAIKFTPSGEVTIHVQSAFADEQHRIHFEIRDTGIGIPANRLKSIFRSFSQVDASTTRKYGGTGLGLAISHQLAEMMGGEMWVESVVGQGSTFHFTILAQAAEETILEKITAVHETLIDKRILIVDDNKTNCLILARQVGAWGMHPTAINDPRKALELIRSGAEFDAAIIDMQMPEIDGVMLAKALHHELGQRRFPMLMLSSIGSRPPQVSQLFSYYANKPVKPRALQRSLLTAIGHTHKNSPANLNQNEIPILADVYPLKLLLAEDNVINQKVTLHMLKRFGLKADIVGNGVEALEALRRQKYDAVLMDIQMPEMDGIEATKKIKREFETNCPYIIAMTANAMAGDKERFLALGMEDYISKPVRLTELESVLIRCIERIQPASALE